MPRARALIYLMLGTIYGTASHPGRPPSEPGLIEAVKARVRTHVYAIGGINASNAEEVMRAGANGVAVGYAQFWERLILALQLGRLRR